MLFQVNHAPVFSTLEFSLSADEYVIAQPNSMLTMTTELRICAHVGRQELPADVTTEPTKKRRNPWFNGLKNMLGGESFFTAEFRAKSDLQTLVLAPESYGDIVTLELNETNGFYITHGSYLANVGATDIQVKYGGLKGLMSKKGLFLMHTKGIGHVFCQTHGAVIHRHLEPDETVYVDNRFMVAFADTVTYRLVKATESLKDSIMSGEGLVNRYTGPGDIYYQTRGKPASGILGTILQAAF